MTTKDNILELLADKAEWSASEVREALPGTPAGSVNTVLSEMAIAGQIERTRPGFYRLPTPGSGHEPDAGSGKTPQKPAPGPAKAKPPRFTPAAAEGRQPVPVRVCVWSDGVISVSIGQGSAEVDRDSARRLAEWLLRAAEMEQA